MWQNTIHLPEGLGLLIGAVLGLTLMRTWCLFRAGSLHGLPAPTLGRAALRSRPNAGSQPL